MGVIGGDTSDMFFVFFLYIGQFDLYKRSDRSGIVIGRCHCAYIFIYWYYFFEF